MADLQLLESGAMRRGLLLQRDVLDARRLHVQLQQACTQLQVDLQVAELRLQQALMKQQVGHALAPGATATLLLCVACQCVCCA